MLVGLECLFRKIRSLELLGNFTEILENSTETTTTLAKEENYQKNSDYPDYSDEDPESKIVLYNNGKNLFYPYY